MSNRNITIPNYSFIASDLNVSDFINKDTEFIFNSVCIYLISDRIEATARANDHFNQEKCRNEIKILYFIFIKLHIQNDYY